jgi:hypothetical protein
MLIYPSRTEFDGTNLIIDDVFSPLRLRIYPFTHGLRVELIHQGFGPDLDFRKENFNLLAFDHEFGNDEIGDNPVGEFLKCIPGAVRAKARRFQYQQLQMMQLLSVVNWREDLSDEDLLVLWLLLGKSLENNWDRKYQLEIIRKGFDRTLGELYEYPHLNIEDLKKIRGDEPREAEFNGLDFVISTGKGSKVIKSLREIPAKLPRLIHRFPEMADSKLLPSVLKAERDYLNVIEAVHLMSLIWSVCESLARILGIDNYREQLNNITNQKALYRTRDQWIQQVENLEKFPSPPLEGSPAIAPIESPYDLFLALESSHYFAPALIDEVYLNTSYFYSAKLPSEVLVKIEFEPDGLKLGDVWSPRGEEILPGTRKTIEEWFEAEVEKSSQEGD